MLPSTLKRPIRQRWGKSLVAAATAKALLQHQVVLKTKPRFLAYQNHLKQNAGCGNAKLPVLSYGQKAWLHQNDNSVIKNNDTNKESEEKRSSEGKRKGEEKEENEENTEESKPFLERKWTKVKLVCIFGFLVDIGRRCYTGEEGLNKVLEREVPVAGNDIQKGYQTHSPYCTVCGLEFRA